MTEHREPPRAAAGDPRLGGTALDPERTFPLRAFHPAGDPPRTSWRRACGLLCLGLSVTLAVAYVAVRGGQAAVAWLHHQAHYRVPFGQIQLVNPPPACFRGGAVAFLEHVRRGAQEPDSVPLLEETPERLARAFKLDPWVERVVFVRYRPGGVSVALDYREPVAWVKLPHGQQQVIDGKGRILPADDLDVEPLGRVIKITGPDLVPPADPRPGVVWKTRDSAGNPDQADARIEAAARLARFLRDHDRLREAGSSPALEILEIIVSNSIDFARGGLFVMNAEGAEIRWGEQPGAEGPGKPTAEEKWRMLAAWPEAARSRPRVEGDYWQFSRTGLDRVCPHPGSVHEPRKAGRSSAEG